MQAVSLILFVPSKVLLMSLLLLSYSLESQALTATTANAIEGSAPYLTFDGVTKTTTIDSLLSITLSDGTKITPQNNDSATIPIVLPRTKDTLANIDMVVPTSSNSVSINDIVTNGHYWGDDDGDGQLTATGDIRVNFTDKNGQVVQRGDALDICNAPYRVELSSAGGHLTTHYGVPASTTFTGGRVTYYINPNVPPVICFVRPNLLEGATVSELNFAGPDAIWNPTKGFLVQSIDPLFYDRNFPTTGSDGLYFDLDIGGGGAQLTWTSVTHEGITATVRRISAKDTWFPSNNRTQTVTRVTLTGPKASAAQKGKAKPGQINKPNLPEVFKLEGKDSNGNVIVRYGFELKKWFVNRGNKKDTASNQASWCDSLGYRLVQVKDLTNAVCSGVNSSSYCRGAVGATPSSVANHYQRRIGAGLFTDWGFVENYIGVGFSDGYYWTSDDTTENNQFVVSSHNGGVYKFELDKNNYGVCIAP
ncbi:hypothetical protein A9G44_07880 [Gilliamella sp. Occ4-3]|nr:hypothetical protein A9G44_07880 [Gilliamella apicola]